MNRILFITFSFLFGMLLDLEAGNAALINSPVEASLPCQTPMFKDQIFKDLKHVALIVYIPNNYDLAVQCHGSELKCATKGNDPSQTSIIDESVGILKRDYQSFPVALQREALTELFLKKIKKKVTPFMRDEKCHEPEVTLIKNIEYETYVEKTDTLTIVVDVNVWNKFKPNVAVMTINLHRAGANTRPYQTTPFAVPVSLPKDKIQEFLDYYIESALPSVGSPLE